MQLRGETDYRAGTCQINTPQRLVQIQTEQSSPALEQNRRSAEAEAQEERKTKTARHMAPKPNVVPEQSMVPEPSST